MNKKLLMIVIIFCVIGGLISSTKLFIGEMSYFVTGVFLLSFAPYMLYTLLSYWERSNIISIITGILLVGFEAYLHMDVFVWNIDALAGIVFIFSPIILGGITIISFVVLTIIETIYSKLKGKETFFDRQKPDFSLKKLGVLFFLPLMGIVLWIIFGNYIMMFATIHERPIFKAIQYRDIDSFKQIVNKDNFDVNQTSMTSGMKPLIDSVGANNAEMISLLIKKGADPNEICSYLNMTSLMWAGSSDAPLAAQALIDNGADINKKDHLGETALHHAIDWRDKEVIKVLLDNGIDINAQDNSGMTPLQKAIMRNNIAAIKTLLKYKADIEIKDDNGHTALHWAGHYGYREIMNLLITEGADTTAKTNNGLTAEDLLKRKMIK